MKLSEGQRAALASARDFGNPTHHLHGRSAHGGYESTWRVLRRNGFLDRHDAITPAGLEALRNAEIGRQRQAHNDSRGKRRS